MSLLDINNGKLNLIPKEIDALLYENFKKYDIYRITDDVCGTPIDENYIQINEIIDLYPSNFDPNPISKHIYSHFNHIRYYIPQHHSNNYHKDLSLKSVLILHPMNDISCFKSTYLYIDREIISMYDAFMRKKMPLNHRKEWVLIKRVMNEYLNEDTIIKSDIDSLVNDINIIMA